MHYHIFEPLPTPHSLVPDHQRATSVPTFPRRAFESRSGLWKTTVRNNSKKYLFLHVKPVLREALLYGRGTRLTCEGLYWWRDGLLLRTKGVARTDVANAARVAKTANFMVVVILLVCSGYDCWDAWVLLAGESMHLHMNYFLYVSYR